MTVYSLPVSEVVSAGPGRVIVEVGAETRVNQARPVRSLHPPRVGCSEGRVRWDLHPALPLTQTQISASLLQRLKMAELPWCEVMHA